MNKINKKASITLIVLLCFVIGGALSFESLARFSRKFESNKNISIAKFKVDAVNTFNGVEGIVPSDKPIAEDKITLTNDNDYPVEFTVKLKLKNENIEKDLLQFLNLTIKIDNEIKEIQDEYVIKVEPKTNKEIFTKIEWKLDENGEVDADIASEATAIYSYDIKAKQLTNNNLEENDNEGSTGGTNSGDGNNGSIGDSEGSNSDNDNNDESSNLDSRILYKSNYSESNDTSGDNIIDGWTAAENKNQSLVYLNNGSLILGTKSYTDLNIREFDLNNESLEFKINANLVESNSSQSEGRGVNLGINLRKENSENALHEFTYQFFKFTGEDKVYIKNVDGNTVTSNLISDMDRLNDGSIESNNLQLEGKIYLESGNIKCTMKVKDPNNIEKTVIEKTMNGKPYEIGSKIYFKVGTIIGKEGIKINSMEVKAVPNK